MTTPHTAAAPEVLTVEETAQVLRLSRQSAYEAVKAGDIPAIRVGRRLLVPRAALNRLLAGDQLGANSSENDNDPA
jgi:excisionase family DNA binding protein